MTANLPSPVESIQREIDGWETMIADDPYREGVIALAALELAKADAVEMEHLSKHGDPVYWCAHCDELSDATEAARAKLYEVLK